jgi:hypothetical protein
MDGSRSLPPTTTKISWLIMAPLYNRLLNECTYGVKILRRYHRACHERSHAGRHGNLFAFIRWVIRIIDRRHGDDAASSIQPSYFSSPDKIISNKRKSQNRNAHSGFETVQIQPNHH